jgi:hypothetical protein
LIIAYPLPILSSNLSLLFSERKRAEIFRGKWYSCFQDAPRYVPILAATLSPCTGSTEMNQTAELTTARSNILIVDDDPYVLESTAIL